MQKITSATDLKSAIRNLEIEKTNALPLLKEEYQNTIENLKPINMIKNSFKQTKTSPDLKDNILGTAVGVTTGFLSRALILGMKGNPVKRLIGTLLQAGITTLVAKHPEAIKSVAGTVSNLFSKKTVTKTPEVDELFI